MITFKQTLLVLAAIGFHARGATDLRDDFSKADQKRIQTITGYVFKDPTLLRSAFTHSSRGNRQFEVLETEGDKLIRGAVMDICRAPGMTPESMHKEIESKNTNAHFAARYQALGLNDFLERDPSTAHTTVYANALESLVGAIAEDYYKKYPHLQGTGRIFKILSGVVQKLVLDDIPMRIAPVMVVQARDPSSKIKIELIIEKEGVRHIQKAKGSTEEAAKTTALKALWSKLGMDIKAKKKTFAALHALCQKSGWNIL